MRKQEYEIEAAAEAELEGKERKRRRNGRLMSYYKYLNHCYSKD